MANNSDIGGKTASVSMQLRPDKSASTMTSSRIKRPVVVSIPATRDCGSLSVEEAEAIISRAGGRPMSKEETKRFKAFSIRNQESACLQYYSFSAGGFISTRMKEMNRVSKKKAAAMNKYHEVHEVRFEADKLVVHVDGQFVERELSDLSQLLLNASDQERNHFQVSPSGYGIHWPLLDEDLSIDGLIGVVHSHESASAVAEPRSNYRI